MSLFFSAQIAATEVSSLRAAAFTRVPKMTSSSTAAADVAAVSADRSAKATDLWVSVNGVATRVLCWGQPIDENSAGPGRLVLCVCGNPGVTEFYERFLQEVYRALNVPVWVVSHAGTNISDHILCNFFLNFFTPVFFRTIVTGHRAWNVSRTQLYLHQRFSNCGSRTTFWTI